MLARHGAAWRASLPRLDGIAWGEFHRGFVEVVDIESAEAFLIQAPALFTAAPVQCVKIIRIDPASAIHMAASPHLARLMELNLGNHTGLCPDSVRSLSRSPYLEVSNRCCCTTTTWATKPSNTSHARTTFGICVNCICRAQMWATAVPPPWESTAECHISSTSTCATTMSATAGRKLAYSKGLYRLSTLWLVNNRIGEDGTHGAGKVVATARAGFPLSQLQPDW